MSTTIEHKMRLSALAIAMALVLTCALPPSAAFASTSSVVRNKKAARAALITQIDAMKIDLQLKTDDLAATTQQIQTTQGDVDAVTAQLATIQSQLQTARTELSERAAALYRSDRIGMVEMLLGSRNIEDLIVRTHYLLLISEQDSSMLSDYRLTQSEGLWLQDSLDRRMATLRGLQSQSTSEVASINTEVTKETTKAMQLDVDIAALLAPKKSTSTGSTGSDSGTGSGTVTGDRTSPDPNTLISEANFRSLEMTAGAVQKFLAEQPGSLASYSTNDYTAPGHAGHRMTAAKIIWEASKTWHISPRVILVTLEKEQSLLSATNPSQHVLDKAMGLGYTDSGKVNQAKYKGFGNQVYYAAKTFDANAKRFKPGTGIRIDKAERFPTNSATWSLYRYTPHYHGNHNFWVFWWSYWNTNPTASS